MEGIMSEIYKVFQLMEFFVTKYDYFSFQVKGLTKENEIFIASSTNPNYQIIHITNASVETEVYDSERIESFKKIIMTQCSLKNVNMLDVYVSNENVYGDEKYDTVCLETDHYSGKDLSNIYPGIYSVIHDVSNQEEEIKKNILHINETFRKLKEKASKRPLLKKIKEQKCPVTLAVIGICIVNFIANLIMSNIYDSTAVKVVLGADYKMFTLGLHQFYRLLTSAFVHSSIIHLFFNLMAFYPLGRILEKQLGSIKFMIMLIFGIIFGQLSSGAMSGNTMLLGLSGGIYCLFTYYIMYFVSQGFIELRSFMPTIVLNLCLNFLPGVSWKCHLGGAVAGLMFYYLYKDYKVNKNIIVVLVVLLIGTSFKYVKDYNIEPYYGGTDMEIVDIYSSFGLNDYANKLTYKLYAIYLGGK